MNRIISVYLQYMKTLNSVVIKQLLLDINLRKTIREKQKINTWQNYSC